MNDEVRKFLEERSFSTRSLKLLSKATTVAEQRGFSSITSECVLGAIISDQELGAWAVLEHLYVQKGKLALKLQVTGWALEDPIGELPFSPALLAELEFAREEASFDREESVHSEHILLGMMRDPTSYTNQVLRSPAVTFFTMKDVVLAEKAKLLRLR
jgi:ATP-dependent Clp protease ATP-binding subunit ClpA